VIASANPPTGVPVTVVGIVNQSKRKVRRANADILASAVASHQTTEEAPTANAVSATIAASKDSFKTSFLSTMR
jgi:hypothetical protein